MPSHGALTFITTRAPVQDPGRVNPIGSIWKASSMRNRLQSTPLWQLSGGFLPRGRLEPVPESYEGNQGVVSWTSRPPQELDAIRHWNTALIRWTFEPYGLAVKRSVLRRLGASPAIYAASEVYENLPQRERFRFQVHDPPRCSWKNEREWRLPGDLKLSDLAPDDAFLFMPALADAEEFKDAAAAVLPIVVLSGCFATNSNWGLTSQPHSV
jgi:hypothetical protein